MASWVPTILLPVNPDELCDRLNLILQENLAGNKSDVIDEENMALADKLLEHKCVCIQKHKFLLIKRLN